MGDVSLPIGAGDAPGPAADAANRVTVGFRPDLIASWLATGTAPALLVELGDQLVASGVTLRPVHPGTTDPQLATWFEAVAPDADTAQRVVAQLRGHPAVTAAFIKPPDAPPG
jgi:phytoene dehydrogenase-like protein